MQRELSIRLFLSTLLVVFGVAFEARAQPMDAAHAQARVPQDQVENAADLPPGSVEAVLLDAEEKPVAGVEVRLAILFQSVSQGESKSSRTGKTAADGSVRFDGLTRGTAYSYRIAVKHGAAEYGSAPFNLRDQAGTRVTLHVFPSTSDLERAVVGSRGFFYIETRDDVFQIELLFRVINLGRVAWVPGDDVIVELPSDFKAFTAGEGMSDTRFVAVEGRGARLVGTFPPGQRDVSCRFQLPKGSRETASFRMKPLPRTAEMRVIAIANTNMGLSVGGFEPPQDGTGPRGDRVLVTRRVATRDNPTVPEFVVTLSGLPVPGPGRWIASGLAFVLALSGAAAARGKLRLVSSERVEGDRARASELLLAEIVALKAARDRNEIGPAAYERTYRALVDALARIGIPSAGKRSKRPAKVSAPERVKTTS